MTYEEARSQIRTGDLIFIHRRRKGGTFFQWMINFFTGSSIYHTGVAIWMKSPSGIERLMVSDIHAIGGRRVVPLSLFALHRMEVCRVPDYANMNAMEEYMLKRVGAADYGYLDLIMIGVREFFGLPARDQRGDVCSAFSAKTWIEGNVPLIDTLVSPGKLYENVKALGIEPTIDIRPPVPAPVEE